MAQENIFNFSNRMEPSKAQSLEEQTEQLRGLYNFLNDKSFNGCLLPMPIITAVPHGLSDSKCWMAYCDVQNVEGVERRYKIYLCVDDFNRDVLAVSQALIYQMIHLFNVYRGILDCTPYGYHNEHFKVAAEAHGMMVTEHPIYGYSPTGLHPQMIEDLINAGIERFAL